MLHTDTLNFLNKTIYFNKLPNKFFNCKFNIEVQGLDNILKKLKFQPHHNYYINKYIICSTTKPSMALV